MFDSPAAPDLSDQTKNRADAIYEKLQHAFLEEARRMSELLASKPDHQIFGKTEFELRDAMHELGTKVLETALLERKKGGTKDRA